VIVSIRFFLVKAKAYKLILNRIKEETER